MFYMTRRIHVTVFEFYKRVIQTKEWSDGTKKCYLSLVYRYFIANANTVYNTPFFCFVLLWVHGYCVFILVLTNIHQFRLTGTEALLWYCRRLANQNKTHSIPTMWRCLGMYYRCEITKEQMAIATDDQIGTQLSWQVTKISKWN